jgi:molybdopterin molybdotransferase
VTPVGGPGSHLIGHLAQSNALLLVEPDGVDRSPGEIVNVLVLDRDF